MPYSLVSGFHAWISEWPESLSVPGSGVLSALRFFDIFHQFQPALYYLLHSRSLAQAEPMPAWPPRVFSFPPESPTSGSKHESPTDWPPEWHHTATPAFFNAFSDFSLISIHLGCINQTISEGNGCTDHLGALLSAQVPCAKTYKRHFHAVIQSDSFWTHSAWWSSLKSFPP